MIDISNFKDVLLSIGFQKERIGNCYKKYFGEFSMTADFDNKKLHYPKGVETNDNTTTNFSHNENFVVFECVNRLMEKGYLPKDVELEPKWRLGHYSKASGKPDILIRDKNGDNLIIIECKTAGKEYRKERTNTETDGGQLFSYWQQDNGVKWLALYASDWKDDKLTYQSEVINCTDDANILKMSKRNKDVKVFANAKNDNERFETWRDTYNCKWYADLLFSEDSQAYQIELKPLRKKDLKEFTPDDKIVNQFEEILRHNNVSDKENAFNRLVALFICKLVDEIKKQDFEEVAFQYKYTDTYETLQDRLQQLHQQGMKEFMKEDIFYVPDNYAENLFSNYTGQKRKAAIEDLKKTIRILKFYSNNDFAFKDVHNEELFYQNGKILVEVVQLFQPYKIVYNSKHQFLGDLFEQLLNKGFKQNEGQFFTPTPITRFIWDSLPLSNYISEHDIPRILDYACGAGHFLTEGVEAINAVRPNEDNSWVESHIYGVEKDYRLARVSKVSMFMNGAGGSNIIFGDGLENYPEKGIEPHSFDILVANPPYSVSGFKRHLALHNNTFHLLEKITLSGSEIETLFVERIAQVLKPEGIAAVILPASILSNSSASYTAARGELLQNFKLHAIVSFGSKTFGATGTNTVTLFLEKYTEPPRRAELVKDFVSAVIDNNVEGDWKDKELYDAYLKLQDIDEETYLRFIDGDLDWTELAADKYLKVYLDSFNTQPLSIPKSITTAEEEEKYRHDKFYGNAIETEKQKLYYFALAYKQETLVVTAPSDNKEQKEFLGYDWSNRKGDEGIKIINPGGMLYDDDDRFARCTIACAIRNSFMGAQTQLSGEAEKYVKWYRLEDMMDFANANFVQSVSLNAKRIISYESKYPKVPLGSILREQPKYGANEPAVDGDPDRDFRYIRITDINEDGSLGSDWVTAPNIDEQYILSEGDILFARSGATAGKVLYYKHEVGKAIYAGYLIRFRFNASKVIPLFVYDILCSNNYHQWASIIRGGSAQPNINAKQFSSYEIPLPPMDIQQKIVAECEAEDKVYSDSSKRLSEIEAIIQNLLSSSNNNSSYQTLRLSDSDIFDIQIGRRVLKQEVVSGGKYDVYSANVFKPFGKTSTSVLSDFSMPSVLWGIDGDWMVNVLPANYYFNPTDHCGVVRVKDENLILPRYLAYAIDEEGKRQRFSRVNRASTQRIKSLTITVPPINVQKDIVEQIVSYDGEIVELKNKMSQCSANKQAILDKYLK